MSRFSWPAGFIDVADKRFHHEPPRGTKTPEVAAVIRARFRLTLPDDIWVREVSTAFPQATFRLLTGVPKGDRALELGEVRAAAPSQVTEAIRTHPDVTAYDHLYAGEHREIAQYEADEKALYEFLWESSLPPEFPIIVENGRMEFDLTATRAQFEAFGDALDEQDRHYELLSLVHTVEEGDLLTDRQRECLQVALRQGYFEVPRACTLAELADHLDIDKSTASETIRRGQARVLQEFLVGRD
jgi:predicted DNA binding protein